MTDVSPPTAVLDTQVALDWLLFDDPATAPLVAAIEAGHIACRTCPTARDELERVLRGRGLAHHGADVAALMARYDAAVLAVPDPVPMPAPKLRCSDPDDQVFLELALALGARWLYTRDRALLKLARRAAALGLTIVAPRRA